jgi:hypothetical protein
MRCGSPSPTFQFASPTLIIRDHPRSSEAIRAHLPIRIAHRDRKDFSVSRHLPITVRVHAAIGPDVGKTRARHSASLVRHFDGHIRVAHLRMEANRSQIRSSSGEIRRDQARSTAHLRMEANRSQIRSSSGEIRRDPPLTATMTRMGSDSKSTVRPEPDCDET